MAIYGRETPPISKFVELVFSLLLLLLSRDNENVLILSLYFLSEWDTWEKLSSHQWALFFAHYQGSSFGSFSIHLLQSEDLYCSFGIRCFLLSYIDLNPFPDLASRYLCTWQVKVSSPVHSSTLSSVKQAKWWSFLFSNSYKSCLFSYQGNLKCVSLSSVSGSGLFSWRIFFCFLSLD